MLLIRAIDDMVTRRTQDSDRASLASRRMLSSLVAAGLLVAVGCSGGDETASADRSGTTVASTEPPGHRHDEPTTELVGEPVDDDERAMLLAELSEAFTDVRSGPVLIELEMEEEGTTSSASIRVDQGRGLLDATWVQLTRRGSEITTLNVVVGGRAFLKSTVGEEAAAALDFVEVGASRTTELLEQVFTGYGRLGPSLDRILLFVESLPLHADIERDGVTTRATVTIDPLEVVDLYADTGLEQTGGGAPSEPVVLRFTIASGRLVLLEAGGTQFHDGEALTVTATLRYRPIEPFELDVPPVDS